MADITNDMSNSNGKFEEEEKESVKLNGDLEENLDCRPAQKTYEESEDYINPKIVTDVNDISRIDGQISEKRSPTLANGHVSAEITTSNDANVEDRRETSSEVKKPVNSVEANYINDSISNTSLNDGKENEQEQQGIDDEALNYESSLKKRDKIPREGTLIGDTFKTEGGLSITVVSAKSTISDRSVHCELSKSGRDENRNVNYHENNILNNGNKDGITSPNSLPDNAKKNKKTPSVTITPRRSSRNLNKQKNYSDKEGEMEEYVPENFSRNRSEDETQEVPLDPLADEHRSKMRNKTIVVSDTKGLVEFASNARSSKSNKKEPTLVIIDTKSILSGRGPVPVSSGVNQMLHSSSATSSPIPVALPLSASSLQRVVPASTSTFSVIPIGLPAQGMYSQYRTPPPQIKPIIVGPPSTTVTPITIQTPIVSSTPSVSISPSIKPPPIILPSLTDDMFVVEAPSFIVPYVYEKPPMKALKQAVEKMQSEIKEAEEKDRKYKDLQESEKKEQFKEKGKEEIIDEEEEISEEKEQTKAEPEVAHKKPSKVRDIVDNTETENMDTDEKSCMLETAVTQTEDRAADSASSVDPNGESPKKNTEAEKKDSSVLQCGKDIKKPLSFFDNPLCNFFIQIGLNLVQEHMQTDLLRMGKRKRDKDGENCSSEVEATITELTKTLECSKENNDPFKLPLKKCELCSFKTESILVMAHHLETPHMKNYTYRCNFCPLEVRSPHDILFHMEAEHNVRGRLERAPAFHQCASCPFEDNQKGKLTRHLVSCAKKYRPERNQEPPLDWEPPAKIPRVTRNRPPSMSPSNAIYQAAMSGLKQTPQNTLLPKLMPTGNTFKSNLINTSKTPNSVAHGFVNRFPNTSSQNNFQPRTISVQGINQGMLFRTATLNSPAQMLLPQSYQLAGSNTSMYQQNQNIKQTSQQSLVATKLLNQPSISITPLPRQTSSPQQTSSGGNANTPNYTKSGKLPSGPGGKNNFVVCEICDGYIKDLEQLRNHMQWIHKVKIHPKMIYNRPPLNCQKCQFRFFTDQGLERHLLGSHGLVTSSMQEAANKGKDGGRCPVCGRVYQWKLLNHVARDHQIGLKPAHLSYKCTVCTATFGMYKQFESHVYSAHSGVARRAIVAKKPSSSAHPPSSSQNEALLKPLKINDEITIIPQPVQSSKPSTRTSGGASISVTSKNKM